jgi:hypothetical protein
MSKQLQLSPQLQAEHCLHVNLDALDLNELRAHEREALEALAGLNDYLSKPGKSVEAVLHAQHLSRKLRLHMMHLRDLIHSNQAAVALTHAIASGHGPVMNPPLPKPGKRSRVIRTPTSADNATSGHILILSNATQCSGTKAVCGGEAKEGEPADSLAKPDGERSEGGGRRW